MIKRKIEGNNKEFKEFIAFIKGLHIIKPNVYPLIDNPIAEALGLFKQDSNLEEKITAYKIYKKCLDRLIKGNANLDYKVIDEFFYLKYSLEKENVLKDLEKLFTEDESKFGSCLKEFFELDKKLKECVEEEQGKLKEGAVKPSPRR
ncbi:hypothetical protein [Thermovibrio sp.]